MTNDSRVRLTLDILLKEMDVFQSEMDKRLDRHAQSFYFCTLLLAGVITGVATFASTRASVDFALLTFICLPFVTTPLAAMFFDDELLRGVTDYHFHQRIAPEIKSLLGDPEVSQSLVRCTLTSRFDYMKNELGMHRSRVAANTRRFIFIVPFLAAAFSVTAAFSGVNGYFTYSPVNGITKIACVCGAVFDFGLLIVTIRMWTVAESIWRKIISL